MYLTNNIIESIHSKLNFYLPKHKTTIYNFINTLESIILNDKIKISNNNRFDYKSRALILLIQKENLNKDLKWITYETFDKYIKDIKYYNPIEKTIQNLLSVYDNNNIINNSSSFIINKKGLLNLGTICYINCIIQILYNIKIIRENILNINLKAEPKNILYSLYKLFYDLYNADTNIKYIDTEYFINNYDDEKIDVTEHKDAHEFLLNLIDKLELKLKVFNKENLFKNLFEFKIQNNLECTLNNNHKSIKDEIFYTLELEIKDKLNIYNSLKNLLEREMLEDKIYCPFCKTKRNMYKTSIIKSLPNIMIFLLKRFEFSLEHLNYIKINDYYEFPEILEMNKYINISELGNIKYRLFAVVVHKGLPYFGHYYSLIKEEENDFWLKYDDSDVDIIKDIEAKQHFFGCLQNNDNITETANAYILFYQKINSSTLDNNNNKLLNLREDYKTNENKKEKIQSEHGCDTSFENTISDSNSMSGEQNSENFEINILEDKISNNNLKIFLEDFAELNINDNKKLESLNKNIDFDNILNNSSKKKYSLNKNINCNLQDILFNNCKPNKRKSDGTENQKKKSFEREKKKAKLTYKVSFLKDPS